MKQRRRPGRISSNGDDLYCESFRELRSALGSLPRLKEHMDDDTEKTGREFCQKTSGNEEIGKWLQRQVESKRVFLFFSVSQNKQTLNMFVLCQEVASTEDMIEDRRKREGNWWANVPQETWGMKSAVWVRRWGWERPARRQVIFLPSRPAFVRKREESINHFLPSWVNAKKVYGRNFPRQEVRN